MKGVKRRRFPVIEYISHRDAMCSIGNMVANIAVTTVTGGARLVVVS